MRKFINPLHVILLFSLMLIFCNRINESQLNSLNQKESKFSRLSGPYLGQKPPGIKAELFAPGMLSAGGSETNITFSPDGKELSYTLYSPRGQILVEPTGAFRKTFIMYSCLKEGRWTEPEEFSFNPARKSRYPFFCPDGKRMFYNSTRNRPEKPDSSLTYIWYVDKKNARWGDPKEIKFEEGFKGRSTGVYPTAAANGNLYFSMWPNRQNGIICMSRYENSRYLRPERLNDFINDRIENHPYIAPDESFLIFDSERKEDNYGGTDIFISFRDKDGEWMKPQNLGEGVNSRFEEARPFLTFDGKYLFFASNRINPELPDKPMTLKELQQLTMVPADGSQHIFWVDAKIINDLKPDHIK